MLKAGDGRRPDGMTQPGGNNFARHAEYDHVGRMSSLQMLETAAGSTYATQTWSYYGLGQMTRQTITGQVDTAYRFSTTQNDGRLTHRKGAARWRHTAGGWAIMRSYMTVGHIEVAQDRVTAFCRRNGVRRLAVFGSVLTDRFSDASDVDVLVEFEPGERVGYVRMAAMERELSAMFSGRKVDLRTPKELSRYFRDEVVRTAVIQYAAE